MTQIVSVSMPDHVYKDIMEKRKIDHEEFSWSHIFRVGYMRLTSKNLSDEMSKAETAEKMEKVIKRLEIYAKKAADMEQKLAELRQKDLKNTEIGVI
jgi:hypothetical protein